MEMRVFLFDYLCLQHSGVGYNPKQQVCPLEGERNCEEDYALCSCAMQERWV